MPTPDEITRHGDSDPDENPWVHGAPPPPENIEVVDHDAAWAALYDLAADQVRNVLGPKVLCIEHVGSTSVPDLAAKPVIDIDLTVEDSAREIDYAGPLESLGYDLYVREPSWHEHRLFRLEKPRVNLHVFSPDSPELVRHVMFRDWLREHSDDRIRYQDAKHASRQGFISTAEYNLRKEPVIREIYDRIFRDAGLL
jgi:GrpB-like predicted nucleotidyltransferase (UPF0157 family)